MDEALRCDRLLLMRAGRIIADTTPDGLLADTGTTDPDAAFLALIERDAVDADGSASASAPRCAGRGTGMNGARTLATAGRVLRQLSHDHRSIALMLIAPSLLVGLFAWLFSDQDGVFDIYGAADPGAVPVHHHVPDHIDHDAARASLGHSRASDDDAARARPTSSSGTRSHSG